MSATASTRLWSHVERRGPDECWLWTACVDRKGYGRIRIDGRNYYSHRVAYEEMVGPIPNGLVLDHLCRTPGCANPRHLEPVTIGENVARGVAVRTHCRHGHEYTAENTITKRSGRRDCRICDLARKREAYARRKAVV